MRKLVLMISLLYLVSEHAAAQTPQLAKDINAVSSGSFPSNFITYNGYSYFYAQDDVNGNALWRTDGTKAGTNLFVDFTANTTNAKPSFIGPVLYKNELYFLLNGSTYPGYNGLWKTDGTAAGTVMVRALNFNNNTIPPVVANGLIFFVADTSGQGRELWRSDGTAEGTTITKNLNGTASSNPINLTAVNNTLFFTATTAAEGRELWKTDGSETGTELVKDIEPGSVSSTFYYLTNVNGILYFNKASSGVSGKEIWKSDGTADGTDIVKDIKPGTGDSNPGSFVYFNNATYFTITSGPTTGKKELWKTDGTAVGTEFVAAIHNENIQSLNPIQLTVFNGALYFFGSDVTNGQGLWKSDGTTLGTGLIKFVSPPDATYTNIFFEYNNELFFQGSTSQGVGSGTGFELWKTDGTAGGTSIIKDINLGVGSSRPDYFAKLNSGIVFSANTTIENTEPWFSDGTEAGTFLLKDIRNFSKASTPTNMVTYKDTLYLQATDGINGAELLKYDDVTNNISLVKDIFPGSNSGTFANGTVFNNELFFTATDGTSGSVAFNELRKTDGSAGGTVLVKDINPTGSGYPTLLTIFNDALFFYGISSNSQYDIWKTDGTTGGSVLLKDFPANFGGGTITNPNMLAVNNTLYFTMSDATSGLGTGNELWKTDGTGVGTEMVLDINPGSASSSPARFTSFNGQLYFTATQSGSGLELWKTDGTVPGTVMVKDIEVGSGSSSPSRLTVMGNTLYFTATTTANGTELWKTDGITTEQVTEINPGAASAFSGTTPGIHVYNGKLYFVAIRPAEGAELWVSDGTAANTELFKNINPGTASAFSSASARMITYNNKFYFAATDAANGTELWVSDGTTVGTVMLPEIFPGVTSSNPTGFYIHKNTLYFSAASEELGIELWKITPGSSSPLTSFWTGAISTAWEDAGNWSDGVPGSNTDAVIPTGRPRYPTINVSTAIKSISAADATSVIVATGINFTVLGN